MRYVVMTTMNRQGFLLYDSVMSDIDTERLD